LIKLIYELSAQFPEYERFGLTNQLRRASVSIASNIAEGSGRTGVKDQSHFYQLAYSSLMEVMNQFIIAKELNFIKEGQLNDCRGMIEKIANKINALRKAALNR